MPKPLMQSPDARSRREADLLLACARTQITPRISDRIRAAVQQEIDWIGLIRLAMRHDVMPLLYRNLQFVCPNAVPESVFRPVRARYEVQTVGSRIHQEYWIPAEDL